MRKGYDPKLVLDKKGNIFAIATGSDACAEHECGSADMQRWLCSGFVGDGNGKEAQLIQELRQGGQEQGLVGKLLKRERKPVVFPNLLSQKLINNNLDHIHFVEGLDERRKLPAAVLWFSERSHAPDVNYRELAIYKDDGELAGAWDARGFAFKVVGEKLVKKLKVFADKLKAGEGCFAGKFLQGSGTQRLGGVIVALHTQFRPEHQTAISKAQQEFEDNLLLKSRSREAEFRLLANPKTGGSQHLRMPGYIWPVWKDGVVGGEVHYALNPDYGVNAEYLGPYTFEQLAQWIVAEQKFKLVPPHFTESAAVSA